MPRQPLPKGTTRAPTGAPVAPISDRPRTIQWEGRAIENLGRTLSAIGGDFGTLALRSQKLAIENEVNTATLADTDTMNQFELDLRAKNEDPLQWGDKAERKMQKLSTNWKFKREAARPGYDEWNREYTSKLVNKLTIAGMKQNVQNYLGNLDVTIASLVDSGQLEQVEPYLQAGVDAKALDEDKAAELLKAAEFSYVDKKAMEKLGTEGEDAAIEFIKQQDKILALDEQSELVAKMGKIAKNLEADAERFSEAKQKEAIGNLFTGIAGTPPQLTHDKFDSLSSALDGDHFTAWVKIVDGIGKVTSQTKTDYKKAIELDMKIFDYWAGLDKSPGDSTSIMTEFATARYSDRYLDDGYWQRLNEWLQIEIPPQNIENLKASFKEIDRSINLFWLTDSEAKQIAIGRGALVRWYLDERIARKKETTEEDFIVKARRLGAMFLEAEREATELSQPKTQEEYDALPSGARYIHPDLGERVKP